MRVSATTLAARQNRLLQTIFDVDSTLGNTSQINAEGISIYRDNLLMTAVNALSISYPVITLMVGNEVMPALATKLLARELPNTGDWGDWGASLADLLAEMSLGTDHPFLIDMARLEWQLHQTSRTQVLPMSDRHLQVVMQQLNREGGAALTLKPAGHTAVITSPYPLTALWRAHQAPSHSQFIDASALSRAIKEQQGNSYLLIYQHQLAPSIHEMSHEEFAWFGDITAGMPLFKLLECHPNFDFTTWFSQAINNHWIELSEHNPNAQEAL